MYDRYRLVTVMLLAAGLILMPAGFYLKATGSVSFVFYIGAAVLAAGIVLSAFKKYISPFVTPAEEASDAPGVVSENEEGSK